MDVGMVPIMPVKMKMVPIVPVMMNPWSSMRGGVPSVRFRVRLLPSRCIVNIGKLDSLRILARLGGPAFELSKQVVCVEVTFGIRKNGFHIALILEVCFAIYNS